MCVKTKVAGLVISIVRCVYVLVPEVGLCFVYVSLVVISLCECFSCLCKGSWLPFTVFWYYWLRQLFIIAYLAVFFSVYHLILAPKEFYLNHEYLFLVTQIVFLIWALTTVDFDYSFTVMIATDQLCDHYYIYIYPLKSHNWNHINFSIMHSYNRIFSHWHKRTIIKKIWSGVSVLSLPKLVWGMVTGYLFKCC